MSNRYSEAIVGWYLKNKRDLPWRNTTDPYRIWISEIILQQTRVNQGLGYYLRFIDRFSSVDILARADEDEVLKYWQGLGYYSRARNLHKASKRVITQFSGVFPAVYTDILLLEGVGEYTAAAIASFAYNLPHATVDGNVYRVLSRLFGIDTPIDTGAGKKEFYELANKLIPDDKPGLHNQAMMEFGALQCTPVAPACDICPLKDVCIAYNKSIVTTLPVKSQKTKVTNRYFNYLFITYNNNTYLQKRTANDIWKNLYEFPLIESDKLLDKEELIRNNDFNRTFSGIGNIEIKYLSSSVKHVLSHRNIFARFITISVPYENDILTQYIKTPLNEIDKYAVSRLMEIFLEKLF